jgi:hypothetical protein
MTDHVNSDNPAMMLVPVLRMARGAFRLSRVEGPEAEDRGEEEEQGVFHW